MNKKNSLFGSIVLGSIIIFVSLSGGRFDVGPHGGRVKSVDDYTIETKVTDEFIYAYLLDKKSKPMSNKGVKCKMRFLFSDKPYIDLVLSPFEKDGFKIRSNVAGYYSFHIHFQLFGKIISTTFENEKENLIVRKKANIFNYH